MVELRPEALRPETRALTELPLTPELLALLRAIEIVAGEGKPSASALARAIDETPQRVGQMVTRNGRASLDCVPKIARATGFRVQCEQLYPGFAWDIVREQAEAVAGALTIVREQAAV